ncbi:MAG: hypothetical protein IJ371_00335 [Clostridia bacterium]|nr:hypothetical protein [Clostridia bacterium]
MKKIITILLTLVIAFSLSLTAFATNESCRYSIADCNCSSSCESCTSYEFCYCSYNLLNPEYLITDTHLSWDGNYFNLYYYNGSLMFEYDLQSDFTYRLTEPITLPGGGYYFDFTCGAGANEEFFVKDMVGNTVIQFDSWDIGYYYFGEEPVTIYIEMVCYAGGGGGELYPTITTNDSVYNLEFFPYGCQCVNNDVGGDSGSTDDNTGSDTPNTEYVYIKENRPLFETPLSDYSVTEGLLLLIFVVTVLNNIFKSHIKG